LLIFAALAGLVSLALAYLIRSIPPFIPCVWFLPCAPEWWDSNIGFPHSGVAAFAFMLGALGWWPLNRFADYQYKDWATDESAAASVENSLELLNSMEDH